MKKILIGLVLSTVFAIASSAPEGHDGGVSPAGNVVSADRISQEVGNRALENETQPLEKRLPKKSPKDMFGALLEDKGDFGPVVTVLAATWHGFTEYVLPNVLTPQFAFGLGTGFMGMYFFPPTCK